MIPTAAGTFPSATGVTPPTYQEFAAPAKVADGAGEPSIGNSWVTGSTFYTAGLDELKVDFDDTKATSTWKIVNNGVTDTTNTIDAEAH